MLDKKLQLIDYEKISIHDPATNKERRLVAFGKYAGLAGTIDTLSILGQRLLRKSWSTPFLHCPPSIYHPTLEDAKRAVRHVGERIATDGLPDGLEPIVFCMTGGPRGNVYSGVREIFDLLPHEIVAVEDLPAIYADVRDSRRSDDDSNQLRQRQSSRVVYGVIPEMKDIYRRNDDDVGVGETLFDRSHFMEHPDLYHATFANRVIPYTQVLINSIYWEHRFPRLITNDDMVRLYEDGNERYETYLKQSNLSATSVLFKSHREVAFGRSPHTDYVESFARSFSIPFVKRLMVVSDISCDIGGSIEFLTRSTTIDRPCYQYDPLAGKEVADTIQDHGVTVFGVDILPTELPYESSEHFGDALQQFLPDLIAARGADSVLDTTKFPPPLSKALITTREGTLADRFRYLDPIMKHTPKQTPSVDVQSMVFLIEGHLFDSGLINQVLDVLEINNCSFEFKECTVNFRPKGEAPVKSTVILKVTTEDKDVDMDRVQSMIAALVDAIVKAEAKLQRMDNSTVERRRKGKGSPAYVQEDYKRTVLLLGSGRVSSSVVDWLGRSKHRTIVVASDNEEEAKQVASLAKRGRSAHLDIGNDPNGLAKLVEHADLVLSFLPAPMHPQVAQACIDARTDLVTASYESNEMRALNDAAKAAGIRIVNEVGLDPGLDHMSAMKMIDEIKDRGGHVTSFVSVCGGLPAPEAADNPLKYKFSWSPRGVLSASQNDAQYRWEGHLVQVSGKELLANASPFLDGWPELHLECLPNRDSLLYETTYGLENVNTLFRGTLRYRGFSSLMSVFQTMGFFDSAIEADMKKTKTWADVLDVLNHSRGGFSTTEDFVLACSNDDYDKARQVLECLDWLGMTGPRRVSRGLHDRSIVDLFCRRLEEKLKYGKTERDMVVMHHTIGAEFDDGTIEEHHSSLQAFGTEATMTAMCKTVGYPAAAVADLLLSGTLKTNGTGLLLPTSKDIYLPTLEAVRREGIVFEEHVKVTQAGSSSQQRVVAH